MQAVPPESIPDLSLKHILVATDFSESSRHALQQAAAIARLHHSHLILLHILPEQPYAESALEPTPWEYMDVTGVAASAMRIFAADECLTGLHCETLIERGSLELALLSVIRERDISLLVVGTRGRFGIQKLLLGSIAEQMFRLADCPVLTVGPAEPSALHTHGRFHSILFATDFSPASRHALSYAVAFASESHAQLTLLHIVEESSVTALYLHKQMFDSARQRLHDLLPATKDLASQPEVDLVNGYPSDEILRVAGKKHADLIVMGVHKSSGFGALASSHLPWTTAYTVVGHAKCPVLTVRG
jgi:nucleotide-binding universal stress UspA family protein